MERWEGCVALVTGASRGIGREICKELVKHRISVFGCARNEQPIRDLAQELSSNVIEYPGPLRAVKCDVSKESEVLAMFKEIKSKCGRIDICINNAGIIKSAPLISGNTNDWKNIMEVNVLGVCNCTREAIKLMQEKSINGVVIQMGCIGGHKIASLPKDMPDPGVAIYNGTKFMVRALAQALRQELKSCKSCIRVSTISPGPVNTEMLKEATRTETAQVFPLAKECLQPADIVHAVVYILMAPEHVNVGDVVLENVAFPI